MPSRETIRRLTSMGMFILPIVVVKMSAWMLDGTSPQSANASATQATPVNADAAAAPASVKWSVQQLAAAKHGQWLKQQPFSHSPLLYEEEHGTTPQIDPTPLPDPISEDRPVHIVLQAVMSSERGRTAVINGRPYREGDVVHGSGAILVTVDCANRSATLRTARTGELVTINVERPK